MLPARRNPVTLAVPARGRLRGGEAAGVLAGLPVEGDARLPQPGLGAPLDLGAGAVGQFQAVRQGVVAEGGSEPFVGPRAEPADNLSAPVVRVTQRAVVPPAESGYGTEPAVGGVALEEGSETRGQPATRRCQRAGIGVEPAGHPARLLGKWGIARLESVGYVWEGSAEGVVRLRDGQAGADQQGPAAYAEHRGPVTRQFHHLGERGLMGLQPRQVGESMAGQAVEPLVDRFLLLPPERLGVRVAARSHGVGEDDGLSVQLRPVVRLKLAVAETCPPQAGLRVSVFQAGDDRTAAQVRRRVRDPGAQGTQVSQFAGNAQVRRSGECLVEPVLKPAAPVEQLGELFKILRIHRPHADTTVLGLRGQSSLREPSAWLRGRSGPCRR